MDSLSSILTYGFFKSTGLLLLGYLWKIALGIAIIWVGFRLVKFFHPKAGALMAKKKIDPTLANFINSVAAGAARIFVVIIGLSVVAPTVNAQIAALVAGAGLAVGLALSGNLGNFAGGVVMLFLRPFKKGDVIKAQGEVGIVDQIGIFHTVLMTFDNTKIFVPNGALSNGTIQNMTSETLRRCDFTFGIAYKDNIDHARQLIWDIIDADERAIRDMEGKDPFVAVTELGDSSVNFSVRVWTKASDLWPFRFDTLEKVKKSFDANGVSIPFPQSEVHLHHLSSPGQ
ncbi:MAG: mechanosensitive ion channel domain-containing protein [Verrucomicrobiota bacterium]